jgi:hypothetical protein
VPGPVCLTASEGLQCKKIPAAGAAENRVILVLVVMMPGTLKRLLFLIFLFEYYGHFKLLENC